MPWNTEIRGPKDVTPLSRPSISKGLKGVHKPCGKACGIQRSPGLRALKHLEFLELHRSAGTIQPSLFLQLKHTT